MQPEQDGGLGLDGQNWAVFRQASCLPSSRVSLGELILYVVGIVVLKLGLVWI